MPFKFCRVSTTSKWRLKSIERLNSGRDPTRYHNLPSNHLYSHFVVCAIDAWTKRYLGGCWDHEVISTVQHWFGCEFVSPSAWILRHRFDTGAPPFLPVETIPRLWSAKLAWHRSRASANLTFPVHGIAYLGLITIRWSRLMLRVWTYLTLADAIGKGWM